MPTTLQFRRGTAAQNDAFTGSAGEITFDTTNKTLRAHDGSTAGGSTIATETYVDNAVGSLSADSISNGTSNVTVASSANVTVNVAGNVHTVFSTDGTMVGTATQAQYADLAEKYISDAEYNPGTVLVIGGTHEVTACAKYADSSAAGVVSTNPAHLMNSGLDAENTVDLALTGRVPCRVVGSISKGDLLTTSEISGVATRLLPDSFVPGCVIGKSLEDYSSENVGTIEILVGKV